MKDRFKFRIPMFSDKGNFCEFQYVELGDDIEHTLCGHNGEPEQCTGLRDVNSNPIYEGDIVGYEWLTSISKIWRDDGLEVVKWHNGFVTISNVAGYNVQHGTCKNVKIIGNIHQNPELIKGNKYEYLYN